MVQVPLDTAPALHMRTAGRQPQEAPHSHWVAGREQAKGAVGTHCPVGTQRRNAPEKGDRVGMAAPQCLFWRLVLSTCSAPRIGPWSGLGGRWADPGVRANPGKGAWCA